MRTTFYIVRHGETHWNIEGRLQGHTDTDLTENGRLQAEQKVPLFSEIPFDRILASDLKRAQETAKILIGQSRHNEIESFKELRERYFGEFEGMDKKQFFAIEQQLFSQMAMTEVQDRFNARLKNEETVKESLERFTMFLRDQGRKERGKKHLVVTHGALIHFLLVNLLNKSFRDILVHNLGHAVIEYDCDNDSLIYASHEGISVH